jgi:hypothetical protein
MEEFDEIRTTAPDERLRDESEMANLRPVPDLAELLRTIAFPVEAPEPPVSDEEVIEFEIAALRRADIFDSEAGGQPYEVVFTNRAARQLEALNDTWSAARVPVVELVAQLRTAPLRFAPSAGGVRVATVTVRRATWRACFRVADDGRSVTVVHVDVFPRR